MTELGLFHWYSESLHRSTRDGILGNCETYIVNRFIEAPATEYWAIVKHILMYIKGTTNFGYVYFKREQEGDGGAT